MNWRVDTAGGREHVLVLLSPAPPAELESEIAAAPHPGSEGSRAYAELAEPTAARLRGIGGLVERPARTPAKEPARLFQRASALADRPEESRGVWIRQIDLENPGRIQP